MRPSASMIQRGYKRSWKNLLLNKRYQLRFTLFMAGLAGVLFAALGYWVMHYTGRTTTIGRNRIISEPCAKVPSITPGAAADEDADTDTVPMALETGQLAKVEPKPEPAGTGTGAGSGAEDIPRPNSKVTIDETSMELTEVAPTDFADRVAERWACELRHDAALRTLERDRLQILMVLIGTGLLLVLGLAVYGIKMTHRVAGPLYKVSLYFAKMRDGRLDKVYNLRKGDQLVSFYEHFKAAHAGVVSLEKADIERLRALVAAIDADPAFAKDPALADRIAELRALLARKEKSVE